MDRSMLLLLVVVSAAQSQQETCLTAEEEPYFNFGTKTAYIFANKDLSNKRLHDIAGCQPIAFWLLNRHGSHNPEASEIPSLQRLVDTKRNVVDNYRSGNFRRFNERICTADLNMLEQWSWNPRQNLSYAGDLTSDGYITTQQLAQAWRQKYPGLLTDNRHDYLFKYENDQRSGTTFRAFTEGLFRAQAERLDIPKENDEKLLRPYSYCPAWTTDIGDNNETLSQRYIFESKREYKEMITNISNRLGFNWDINKETIQDMYQMCRYNKAWDVSHISPWCSAFTKEDLKRLEYAEDLETYYKYGYGSPVNKKIGCTLIKDMLTFFKNHAENDGPQQPLSMIHFTEAPMILLTHTAMGTHYDSAPLTGDNYHTNSAQNRKWRTSSMAPFNANLAAALYKCTPNGSFQINEKYQVLLLENEKTINLDGCRVGLCDWSFIKEKFGEVAGSCDLKFCNSATKVNSLAALSIAFFGSLARFVLS